MKERTLNAALEAFWATIAVAHPEIKTGDLDPLSVIQLERAAETAYRNWYEGNK